jgi:ribosomal protein L11 methyltransferase
LRYSNFGNSCRNEGAQPIDAIDIDNWCYLNSIENAERNNCHQITYEGDAALLKDKKMTWFDYINRNILLDDICKVMSIVWILKVRFFWVVFMNKTSLYWCFLHRKGLKYVKSYKGTIGFH